MFILAVVVNAVKYDFNHKAVYYDQWYQTRHGRIYDKVEKRTIDKILSKEKKGLAVLEVGCGTGHWSRYFSDKGSDVTGIDMSAEMIKIARQKNIPNSRFEVADGRNLPFEKESFDLAVAITVLEFTTEPDKIISEMVRCIKKSHGSLVIGVLNAQNKYNQKRKNEPGSVYASANLFSTKQIYRILSAFGKVKLLTTGFIPPKEWLLGLSPLWELAGCFFCPHKGAFIAARLDL